MATKKELIAQQVAEAVGAGKPANLETVDFSDPHRPKTCLEVDFPILPVNELASIEAASGASKKPVYQMSKWWARRQSSVFRALLIAAATRAPDDHSRAASLVWKNFYANHQLSARFEDLKVADIFMGGGTTLVEGSRLGMQMVGNDLNPVAWFVVKQELAQVDLDEVQRLLAAIEAEVRPQIIPFYYCDGPNGEKGTWTHLPTGRVEGADFDPMVLSPGQRAEYKYEGPEMTYAFWAKHGPCLTTGCSHRTPVISNPVVASKVITVKYWQQSCLRCQGEFQIDDKNVRLAPEVPLSVAPTEPAFVVLDRRTGATCPHCGYNFKSISGKAKTKKVELSLLIHTDWLKGTPAQDSAGADLGGSAQDDAVSTGRWNQARATMVRLLEVRGKLASEVRCPDTGTIIKTGKGCGTVPKKSHFTCGSCGNVHDVLEAVRASKKTGPLAAYAVQVVCPAQGEGERFFRPFTEELARPYIAAVTEWERRKDTDLANYWPKTELPYGFMTHHLQGGVPNHGHTHWWTLFNPRQLLTNSLLLKAIREIGDKDYSWGAREFVLGAFQQFLRCNTSLSIWHLRNNQISAGLSNSNFHPKSTCLEPSAFAPVGDGSWRSAVSALAKALHWRDDPWELVGAEFLKRVAPDLKSSVSGRSVKTYVDDAPVAADITCGSSTDLSIETATCDLVITDPPFGGLLHYSELSDFFYVWLRLVLKDKYPDIFGPEYTPKSLEAVANKAREPDDPDGFYQRILTQCWREAHRILKPGGILAFTFHHSEDEPWVAVLESLFDAGFYLEATYPIRSDETKGEGEFGSKKIEYDIIHVCRKRLEEPKAVSWARLRREVLQDVRQVEGLLQNHANSGLPAADVQVIRRGKALEYFSRHYGKVYVDEGRPLSVRDALIGINQLLEEDADQGSVPPPVEAEPLTRQFLRVFGSSADIARDQIQKFLRGTITTPDDFVQRGWCYEKKKVFHRTTPQDFAREWADKPRKLAADLDQALVLIGACFVGSGINAQDVLRSGNLDPHNALKPLLEWLNLHGPDADFRQAASRAITILRLATAAAAPAPEQGTLFGEDDV